MILDVGACEGEDSIRYQRRFPQAAVYAFEPLPGNVERARRHFADYGTTSINLEQVALADLEGEATFHVSAGQPPGQEESDWDYGNKSSSLLPPAAALAREHPWLRFDETLTVPVTTLERYAATHGIAEVDLLHLDVQGAELKVLAGAGPLLQRIKVVWLEAETVTLYEGQPLRDAVETFMRSNGFVKVVDAVGPVSGDQLYVQAQSFARPRVALLRLRYLATRPARRLALVVRKPLLELVRRSRGTRGRA